MNGLVFDLQRYAVHDGPGIRTLVFLKGCPLRCQWCANPESQTVKNEVMTIPRECIGVDKCGLCLEACSQGAVIKQENSIVIDREKCNGCGECATACPCDALMNTSRLMTSEEVVNYVLKDIDFYSRSGGGVTLSGGEPLFQYDFCLELVKAFKQKNLHVAMETIAFCEWNKLNEIAKYVDLFLIDIKHMDPSIHKKYTGTDNRVLKDNLMRLVSIGANINIRVPLIPGINDQLDNLMDTAEFVKNKLGLPNIGILPYHRLGQSKYEQLGKDYLLKALQPINSVSDKEYFGIRKQALESFGLEVSIGS
ncbi:glycyl-radical enzyme activating protein [Clostridium bovifaecis]|uniref:Glycyl-radical enzyme activating protein n=1 Tax=Clostridium bovifaecis TaxID=2184719 RepID=A0A6I6F9S0_9CLOT|nr:glycyl-radical enzyme activating protein [Clostridium bovifaecis]